jgi:hydrogenase-1 operon protein HyaE
MTAPASSPAVADPSLHPLLAQLIERHGVPELGAATFDAFVRKDGHTLLLFTEDPVRYRETLDLAVILPEILKAFPGRMRAGVLLPEAGRAIAVRYGFRRWPALVLLKDGDYVGALDGLRNWDDYLNDIAALLESPVTRPPSIGVAVKGPGEAAAGCA